MNRTRVAEILIWILTAFFVLMMFMAPVRDLWSRLTAPSAGFVP